MPLELRWLRRVLVFTVEIVLAGAVSVQLTACSLILPSTAMRHNRRYPVGELTVSRVGHLPGHPRVRLVTAGGDTIAGRFGSIQLADDGDYAQRYRTWRSAGHDDYPELGEPIRLDRLNDDSVHGRFLGFGARTIWIDGDRSDDDEIALETVHRMERRTALGPPVDSMLAQAVFNDLPSRAVVRIHLWPDRLPAGARHYADREGRRANIPLNEIETVILDSNVASVEGALLTGVAMDAAIVLIIANAKDAGPPPRNGCEEVDYGGWPLLSATP